MKKSVSLLLALTLLASLLCAAPALAADELHYVLTLETASDSTATAPKVDVKLAVDSNSATDYLAVGAIQLALSYDASKLTLSSLTLADGLGGTSESKDGVIAWSADSGTGLAVSETAIKIATASFTPKAGVSSTTVSIKFADSCEVVGLKYHTSAIKSKQENFMIGVASKFSVSLSNAGVTDAVTERTAELGTDFNWTPSVSGSVVYGVSYQIGTGESVVLAADATKNDGSYTIPGSAITDNITLTYMLVAATWKTWTTESTAIPESKQIAVLQMAEQATGYALDGTAMYRFNGASTAELYGVNGGYVAIVDTGLTAAQLSAKLTATDSAADVLANSAAGVTKGDLDKNGKVDSRSSNIVSALLNNTTPTDGSYTVTDWLRLSADVTCDGHVTATDAQWIIEQWSTSPSSLGD